VPLLVFYGCANHLHFTGWTIFNIPIHVTFRILLQRESHSSGCLWRLQSISPLLRMSYIETSRTLRGMCTIGWEHLPSLIVGRNTQHVLTSQHVSLFSWHHEAVIDCVRHRLLLHRSWLLCIDESSARIACVFQLDALGSKIFVRSFEVPSTCS